MLFAAPLALVLLAAAPEGVESRGTAGTMPEDAVAQRPQPRWRAGIGAAALMGLATYEPSFGVGFTAQAGVIFDDRFSLLAHGEVGTIVFTLVGSGGVSGEYLFGERLSLGLGVAMSAWSQMIYGGFGGSFWGLTFPVRVTWALSDRAPGKTRREGWIIGLQVAPGFSLQPTNYFQFNVPPPPEAGLAATFSLAYTWW
jgi:hypothetical protein